METKQFQKGDKVKRIEGNTFTNIHPHWREGYEFTVESQCGMFVREQGTENDHNIEKIELIEE